MMMMIAPNSRARKGKEGEEEGGGCEGEGSMEEFEGRRRGVLA